MKIYCISGLGVDERAFGNIRLPNVEFVHVSWIDPLPKENVTSYALRLFQIEKPDSDSVYMGVSFGGMIAQEWAKLQTPKELILISTGNSLKDVQPLLRIPGKMGLNRFLHPKMAVLFSFASYYLFGVKSRQNKEMLKDILRDTDPKMFLWATGALLRWSIEKAENAIRIHGTNDRMISPPKDIDLATEGGHFTIYTHGKEISAYLQKRLA